MEPQDGSSVLNQPTRLEAMVIQKMASLEIFVHQHIRCEAFSRRLFVCSLFLASALAACGSFFRAGTWSLEEANAVCHGRHESMASKLLDKTERENNSWTVTDLLPRA